MKRYAWKLKMKKAACSKGSMRSVKRGHIVVRVCCPKGPKHWNRGRCKVGMRAYEVGTALSGLNVSIPAAHLREDVREAKAMIRELKRGITRDVQALKRR